MGTCGSKVHNSLDEFNKTRAPGLHEVGLTLAASTESPTSFWKAEPRVILANRSAYSVSYWVVQEDKKRTTEHVESIVSSIGLHLNVGNTGGNLAGDLERTTEDTTQTGSVVYFLMRDHRMCPGGRTQPTQVPFPMDCHDVRVYGFFEENGQWRRFKDKVYSIAREKKDFHITALTSNIIPYAQVASTTETRGESLGVRCKTALNIYQPNGVVVWLQACNLVLCRAAMCASVQDTFVFRYNSSILLTTWDVHRQN